MSLQARPVHPLLQLVHPKEHLPRLLIALAVAVVVGGFILGRGALPLWGVTSIGVAILLVPASLKWRDDAKQWGLAAALLSMLLALQGFHFIEHAVQLVQFYLLDRPGAGSQGLISALNVEWVHFSWNWLVWGVLVFLLTRGLRNVWMYLLFVWATLHSLEHTYMLVRYLQVSAELRALGQPAFEVSQTLPGVIGRNGLLALSSWCGRIPGLTTAPRVLVHFWWNFGEVTLLLLAAWRGVPNLLSANLPLSLRKTRT
jgi:hypothetical protein